MLRRRVMIRVMRIVSAVLLTIHFGVAQDWGVYGGDPGGTRYSTRTQISRDNVGKLKQVWIYHTGALEPKTQLNEKAAFEATPILVEGTLYLSTPFNKVIALDPGSGAEKWTYDPKVNRSRFYSEVTSRGVAAWTDSKATDGAPCRLRIFEGTIDGRLISVDGKTGSLCSEIDLTRGVVFGPEFDGNYQVTSAPTIVG